MMESDRRLTNETHPQGNNIARARAQGKTDGRRLPPANNQRFRHFFFTFNNPSTKGWDPERLELHLQAYGAESYVFQLEKGEKTGTPHYQGQVSFENPRGWGATKKCIIDAQGKPIANWGVCGWDISDGNNPVPMRRYCQKKATRVLGPWSWERGAVKKNREMDPEVKRLRDAYHKDYMEHRRPYNLDNWTDEEILDFTRRGYGFDPFKDSWGLLDPENSWNLSE